MKVMKEYWPVGVSLILIFVGWLLIFLSFQMR